MRIEFLIAGDWTLDPNEVFRHAEQFNFVSGVFKNSSQTYLVATKGNTAIQFVFSDGALRLYRVTITN